MEKSKTTGYSFKHCRNVGRTLAKIAKLTRDEREAFLGHSMAKYMRDTYTETEAEISPEYLSILVNLIGAEYFDGETVGKK